MRAVVSGGAGFIGSNLVDRLVDDGAEVLVVDDLSTGSEANLTGALAAGGRLEKLDIRDGARLRDVVVAFRPTTVFHLAAQIDVRASMADPGHDASVNVLGSINMFAAALAAGARRVVNTSTGGAIYGSTDVIPTPETEPARPLSAYGLSKRTAEEYGAWFRSAHGLDVVTLRYGNVYGPRQDPTGDAGVIARFCDRAINGEQPLVFGDGRQTRDYVYVADIVSANVAAASVDALARRRLQRRHRYRGERPGAGRRRRPGPPASTRPHSPRSSVRPDPVRYSEVASTSPRPVPISPCPTPARSTSGWPRP